MDDDDEAWVKRQRASYRPSPNKPGGASASTAGAKTKDTKSDAVLNCPACMCAVCLDCQRYDVHMHINRLINHQEIYNFELSCFRI